MKRWPSRTPHGVGVGLLILFTCCVARRVQRKLPPNVAYSLLTKAERAKITAVEKWASSLGATSNIKSKNLKVNLYRNSNRGLGYWVRHDNSDCIKKHELIFSVPIEACVSIKSTESHKEIAHVYRRMIDNNKISRAMGEDAALALFLMIEARLGNESLYQPYIDFLPHKIHSPILWSPLQLEFLQETRVKWRILGLKLSISRIYDEFIATNNSDLVHFCPRLYFGMMPGTLQEFRWAIATIWSRAATINMKGLIYSRRGNFVDTYKVYDDGFKRTKLLSSETIEAYNRKMISTRAQKSMRRILVPMLDSINHNRTSPSMYHYDPKLKRVQLIAGRQYENGEEVDLNYGFFTNEDLFVNYGFSSENHELDFLTIPAKVYLRTDKRSLQERILQHRGEDPRIVVSSKGVPLGNTMFVLRVLTFSGNTTSAFELDQILSDLPGSKENQLNAYKLLFDVCQASYKSFNTTLEEDAVELPLRKSKWIKTAIRIRMGEKLILNRCMKYAKRAGQTTLLDHRN
jgi:hypothetical protein